jgi:hypothetical protein
VNEAATPRSADGGTALYVYGVVPKDSSADLFADVRGIDPSQPVVLLANGAVAAITSAVPLDEFGVDAIENHLRDPNWLEQKVRAHDAVLEAALGRTTVLPFRFGAVYLGEKQVRQMLVDRPELEDILSRLRGMVELGVKGILERETFRDRLATERGIEQESLPSGRAYMERKQLDRDLDEAVGTFAADCAQDSHEQLAAVAAEARANPVHRPELTGPDREMLLNGAYLVHNDHVDGFRSALAMLQARYRADGVTYELTGPWPPYNFVQDEEEA